MLCYPMFIAGSLEHLQILPTVGAGKSHICDFVKMCDFFAHFLTILTIFCWIIFAIFWPFLLNFDPIFAYISLFCHFLPKEHDPKNKKKILKKDKLFQTSDEILLKISVCPFFHFFWDRLFAQKISNSSVPTEKQNYINHLVIPMPKGFVAYFSFMIFDDLFSFCWINTVLYFH